MFRAASAWVVEHVSGLEPHEAAVRTGQWERLASPIGGRAPDRMVERDPFVPAVPVLLTAERARQSRSSTPQEIEDRRLRDHSPRHRTANAPHGSKRSRPGLDPYGAGETRATRCSELVRARLPVWCVRHLDSCLQEVPARTACGGCAARELRPGLWHWQAAHPDWSPEEPWEREVSSYAIDDGAVCFCSTRGGLGRRQASFTPAAPDAALALTAGFERARRPLAPWRVPGASR